MNGPTLFILGVLGSAVVEVARMFYTYERRGRLPRKYADPVFWALRVAVALCAGALVIVYGADTALQAIGLGASAPTIILALGKGIQSQEERAAATRRRP